MAEEDPTARRHQGRGRHRRSQPWELSPVNKLMLICLIPKLRGWKGLRGIKSPINQNLPQFLSRACLFHLQLKWIEGGQGGFDPLQVKFPLNPLRSNRIHLDCRWKVLTVSLFYFENKWTTPSLFGLREIFLFCVFSEKLNWFLWNFCVPNRP